MSFEQLDQLAAKVSQALFLIQKLRAENSALASKLEEQTALNQELSTTLAQRDESIQSLQSTLTDREGRLSEQDSRIQSASERLQGLLSTLAILDPVDQTTTTENTVQEISAFDAIDLPESIEPDLELAADENAQQLLF